MLVEGHGSVDSIPGVFFSPVAWRSTGGENRVLYTVRGEVLECMRTLTSASSVITSQSDRKGIKFIIRASDWLYCVQ